MAIPDDKAMMGELHAMYDAARRKKHGEIQVAIIIAMEVHKARIIAEKMSPQKFEWPNDG